MAEDDLEKSKNVDYIMYVMEREYPLIGANGVLLARNGDIERLHTNMEYGWYYTKMYSPEWYRFESMILYTDLTAVVWDIVNDDATIVTITIHWTVSMMSEQDLIHILNDNGDIVRKVKVWFPSHIDQSPTSFTSWNNINGRLEWEGRIYDTYTETVMRPANEIISISIEYYFSSILLGG